MQNRAQALEALRSILRGCDNLDGYVAKLDAQVAKTGIDNAFVRKALGQVYNQRGQYDKAIANFVSPRAAAQRRRNLQRADRQL